MTKKVYFAECMESRKNERPMFITMGVFVSLAKAKKAVKLLSKNAPKNRFYFVTIHQLLQEIPSIFYHAWGNKPPKGKEGL